MKFTDIKSETLNLRVSPTFKRALKEVANQEQRSMVNMLEVLLSDYCYRKGVELADVKYAPGTRRWVNESHRVHARSGK